VLKRLLHFLQQIEPVFQILYVVVSLLFAFGLWKAIAEIAKRSAPWWWIVVVVVLSCAAGAAVTYAALRRSPKHRFCLKLKELTYVYYDETHMCCTRHFEIESRVHSMDVFTDRYRWSGTGPATLKLTSDGGHVIEKEYEREFWQYYDVRLSPPLKKHGTTTVESEIDCVDSGGTAKPFLSTTIEQPTERLVLRVILPSTLRPHTAIAQIYQHYTADAWIDFEELKVDPKTGEIRWDVPKDKIKMWQKYVIYFPN